MPAILKLKSFNRLISLLLICAVLNLMNGCYYYKVTRAKQPPEPTITRLQAENNFFILHMGHKVWHLTDIVIDANEIKGKISVLKDHFMYETTDPESINRYRKNKLNDESGVKDEVHIYVTEYRQPEKGIITIPVDYISKIEVYDPAVGATIASWVFSFLGVSAGIYGIFIIIILLTKSSCPFIYVYDGTNYAFAGEIFSGATQPGLERDDYLPLPALKAKDDSYSLKISNKVHEIQHIDLVELLVADHPDDISVLMDKYGSLQSFSEAVTPTEVRNLNGKNILHLVRSKDTLFYAGDEQIKDKRAIEEIIMKFTRPGNADSARLIIRAKNDFWLDALFTKFHSLFGARYESFSRKQEAAPREELQRWLFDQHIPISVYMEKNGTRKFIDYYNIAGPMAYRDDILAFSLDGADQDTIKIMIDYGYLFWDIDYVAMDFSTQSSVKLFTLPLKTAVSEKGIDLMPLLDAADHSYYVQEEIGNEALLSFDNPALSEQSRTIFLHTRGYYKILREQQGKPDKKKLRTFKRPGRFPEFSKELFLEQTTAE